MLYIIYGTNPKKRQDARNKIIQDLKEKNIIFDDLLEISEIEEMDFTSLSNHFKNASLFGERILIKAKNLLSKADPREFLYKNLENLISSENIFLLDEAFSPAQSIQKIERDLAKLDLSKNIFNATEENTKRDIEPFKLCKLIESRNKKLAWQEWKNIYEEWGNSEEMAIHGALWWKWKNMWAYGLDTNKNNYFSKYRLESNLNNYSTKEIEKFGKEIAFMAMKANNGEENLMLSIERLILRI